MFDSKRVKHYLWLKAINSFVCDEMASIISSDVSVRVSSVLNRDVKQFGKKHLFDGDDETCWNSDQGSPQWIELNFQRNIHVGQIHLMFQGGFSGRECCLEAKGEGQSEFKKVIDFHPEDVNSMQVFSLPPDAQEVSTLRIVFSNSTDFFGRITVYKLDVTGS